MAAGFKHFTIRKNKIKRSFHPGFIVEEDGTIKTEPEVNDHKMFLDHIDSGEEDMEWGRLKLEGEFSKNVVVCIRIFASNEINVSNAYIDLNIDEYIKSKDVSIEDKIEIFSSEELFGAKTFTGETDILLYDITGRYLWLEVEVLGEGDARIDRITLNSPGNLLMDVFPEVYKENDDFFKRYLSIFSSLFIDFEYEIESVHRNVDLETAPKELLNVYGEWLGLDMSYMFLEEDKTRKLLSETYELNKIKGTRRAIMRLIEIMIDEKAIIIERSMLQKYMEREEIDTYNRLYGKSPYDFTILINKNADEQLQSQLLFLLNQFKPIRSKINVVFLSECASLDSYCYLDVNARIHKAGTGSLDSHKSIDGSIILE